MKADSYLDGRHGRVAGIDVVLGGGQHAQHGLVQGRDEHLVRDLQAPTARSVHRLKPAMPGHSLEAEVQVEAEAACGGVCQS